LDSLKNEVQKMKFFNYQSSIVLIIPHRSLTSIHLTPKIAFVIAKTLSKILLEHFSRNDIIAYYGNSIFGILVTHSALDVTEEKIERLLLALKKSSLFISGKEIELKVKIGVSELMSHIKTETSLLKTLDALKIANRSQETYHIL
jgi:GGDEF domain-containing protein